MDLEAIACVHSLQYSTVQYNELYGYLEIATGLKIEFELAVPDRIWRCEFYFWRLRLHLEFRFLHLEIAIEFGNRGRIWRSLYEK